MRVVSSSLVAAVALGCGTDVRPLPDDTQKDPDGYTRLIGRTWSVEPGQSAAYRCARFTVPEDMYVTNIKALAPPGTHHTVLSVAGIKGTAGPDGDQDDCGVATIGMVMLYAGGVGTSPLDFPDGVGIKLSAGEQLHLNLHLTNASDEPLDGESAILVKAQTEPPAQLAEMVFAGKFHFSIPPTNQPFDVSGGCVSSDDYSLFAVWPHMHQMARHQKLELIRDGNGRMLHDRPFDFREQTYHLQQPITDVKAGDELRVTCTFVNSTSQAVTWGDGDNQEMCFAGLYRFPAANQGVFRCTDNPGP